MSRQLPLAAALDRSTTRPRSSPGGPLPPRRSLSRVALELLPPAYCALSRAAHTSARALSLGCRSGEAGRQTEPRSQRHRDRATEAIAETAAETGARDGAARAHGGRRGRGRQRRGGERRPARRLPPPPRDAPTPAVRLGERAAAGARDRAVRVLQPRQHHAVLPRAVPTPPNKIAVPRRSSAQSFDPRTFPGRGRYRLQSFPQFSNQLNTAGTTLTMGLLVVVLVAQPCSTTEGVGGWLCALVRARVSVSLSLCLRVCFCLCVCVCVCVCACLHVCVALSPPPTGPLKTRNALAETGPGLAALWRGPAGCVRRAAVRGLDAAAARCAPLALSPLPLIFS